jgi:isopropylmalate/homocitrate/citramalate synthase
MGNAVAQLVEALRYKLIPDGVSGISHCHNDYGPGVD